MPQTRLDWTEQRIADLTRLWATGMSARLIAIELDCGATKNAVLGKVHRLNIAPRALGTSSTEASQRRKAVVERQPRKTKEASPAPALAAPAKAKHGGHLTGPGLLHRIEQRAKADDRPAPKLPAFADRAGSLGIMELRENTCRWPFDASPARFCGCRSVPGKPYCAEHFEMSRGTGTPAERRADDLKDARRAA